MRYEVKCDGCGFRGELDSDELHASDDYLEKSRQRLSESHRQWHERLRRSLYGPSTKTMSTAHVAGCGLWAGIVIGAVIAFALRFCAGHGWL